MSEESKFKVPRSVEEIGQEYQQCSFKAGDLAYKIDAHKRDLQLLMDHMRDLNFEFVQRRDIDQKAAEAEAKKKSEDEAAAKSLENNVVELTKKEESNG